jgi:hypothetical protein
VLRAKGHRHTLPQPRNERIERMLEAEADARHRRGICEQSDTPRPKASQTRFVAEQSIKSCLHSSGTPSRTRH